MPPPAGARSTSVPSAPGTGEAGPLQWATVRWTDRSDGDLRPHGRRPPARWAEVVDRPVSWARQVHGDRVVVVEEPGGCRGEEADALLTVHPGAALAVLSADCATVALASPEGVIGAVHAGWAGLVAGIVERAVEGMRLMGAGPVEAALGPCIRPECYEFAPSDLGEVAARLGPGVRSRTREGRPALDLPAAVGAALAAAGARLVHDEGSCTACAPGRFFSHRARREAERQAMLVWRG